MPLTILLVASLAALHPALTTCQNAATVNTQAVTGPNATAMLKVSAEDDHAKDTHLCMADYQLLITRSDGSQSAPVEILSSDNNWGRNISVQLSGFSHDGKRILGIVREGGSTPVQQVFDYNTDNGTVRLFDLIKLVAHRAPTKCLASAEILGTTESGAIVSRLSTGKHCTNSSRWLLNSVYGPLRLASKHSTILELYKSTSAHE
jgi:hypothetical protein